MQTMKWYQLEDTGVVCTLPAPNQPSLLSPSLRGLAYGDGFFTTMGVYQAHILWQDYHKARLNHHLNALYLHLTSERQLGLWLAVTELADSIEHGLIKVIVTRQQQHLRGYAHSSKLSENNCHVWIGVKSTQPLATQTADFLTRSTDSLGRRLSANSGKVVLQQPSIVATCLDAQLACLPPSLAGIKSLNRLDSVLIAGELEQRKLAYPDLAEGLVRDMTGSWVEGVMSNVFYQLNGGEEGEWNTPPIVSSGVNGVMRQVIMDEMDSSGAPAQERILRDEDLLNLKAMFFCNAVRGVIPVRELVLLSGQLLDLCLDTFPFNEL